MSPSRAYSHPILLAGLLLALSLGLTATGRAQPAIPKSPTLAPGLYVHVIDGLIHLSNPAGTQNFSAGQFGFTPNVTHPPIVLPNNPGLKFTPPPAFSSPGGTLVSTNKTLPTDNGDLTSSSDKSVSTVAIVGGTVTVNVITGQLTFTAKDGTKSTLDAGKSAIIEGGAVKTLMNTTEALASGNIAFAQVTQHALLQAVAAVAAIAQTQPNNAPVGNLLTNLVTQVTTLAANSGDTALVANVVAFAVANAPKAQQAAITKAASDGIDNSSTSATAKSALAATVTTSADAGAQSRIDPSAGGTAPIGVVTTPVIPIDPSLVTIVSPSS